MKDITKHYTNDDITIVWKPAQCIHSAKCAKGLGHVFDPNRKPWVDMSNATSKEIMAQIDACPSGALFYFKNNEAMTETNNNTEETKIDVMKNGPLLVHGKVCVKDADGNETQKDKVTAFCRCGASANKPYCDGEHNKVGFNG